LIPPPKFDIRHLQFVFSTFFPLKNDKIGKRNINRNLHPEAFVIHILNPFLVETKEATFPENKMTKYRY